MTKHIRKVTLLLALALSFGACNKDRLQVDPVNQVLSSTYYQTELHVSEALIGAYDPVGWTMAYGQWISPVMFGEIRSDNANAGGDPSNNDQPGWQEFDDFTETNVNTVLHPLYRRSYIGINRVNSLLNNTDTSDPELSSDAVQVYLAEAKFLRAFYHFELFRHFGPIPVVTEELAPDVVDLERNTLSEVMQQIISDCEDAAELLPTLPAPGQEGRATKGAALALMGKAYLYWADLSNDDAAKFDAAASALQEVVDLGVYELVDDLGSLYTQGSRNTTEAVFEIQHNPLYQSDWYWFEGIDGNGMIQLCGIRGLCAEHPTYEAGWGFMAVTEGLYNHFLDDDHYRRDVAIASEATLEQDMIDAGLSCDPIIDATQNNPIDYTGYFQVKYQNFKAFAGTNVNGGNEHLTKAQNTHYIRYADVLLMLAEALLRGSSDNVGEAMYYVDIVRERAAGPGNNEGSYRTSSQLMVDEGWSMEEVIWYERRSELACEGDRWTDLVRSGRAESGLFVGDGDKESNFNLDHLWLPIALEETVLASGITTYPDASLFD